MYILFDFHCGECDHKFEAMVKREEKETPCKACGCPAKRLIAAPRPMLDALSGDFPGATLAWERMHEKGGR